MYVVSAGFFILILLTGFAIHSLILLGNLNSSQRERTITQIDSAIHFFENRWQIYTSRSIQFSQDGNLQNLISSRNPMNPDFERNARSLMDNFIGMQFVNPEIVDMIIWHENLDIFFNISGSWNHSFLSHWEIHAFPHIDFNLIGSQERHSILPQGNYVVYYNNYLGGTHIYILIRAADMEAMLAQLIPHAYGAFVVKNQQQDTLFVTNWDYYADREPDKIIAGGFSFEYHFFQSPTAYTQITNNILLMSVGLSGCVIALAVLLLLRIKKDLYNPIPQILSRLDPARVGNTPAKKVGSEFELIFNALDEYQHIQHNFNFSQAITHDDISTISEKYSGMFCVVTILFEDENGSKEATLTRAFSKECAKHEDFNCHQIYSVEKYSLYFFFVKNISAYNGLVSWLDTYVNSVDSYSQVGVSGIHDDISDIRIAMKESLQAFWRMPVIGLSPEEQVAIYSKAFINDNSGKISTIQHNILITATLSSDISNVKKIVLEIIDGDKAGTFQAKRQLLLYMYDTICILTGNIQKEDSKSKRATYEGIFNLQLLYALISRDLEELITPKHEGSVIDTMLSWIDENISKDISLSDLADAMNMSYSYAGRYFKNNMGISFLDYLQQKRIVLSMQLLAETSKNTEEITIATGFVSVKTFFRVFKKYTKTTPDKYRKASSSNL